MNVLVISDDHYHPASIVKEGLPPLAERGFQLDFLEDPAKITPETLGRFPAVVFCKSNLMVPDAPAGQGTWMTDREEEALVSYVEGGGGLLVLHAGCASYDSRPRFTRLCGSFFTFHPPACPVAFSPEGDHPIVRDIKSFSGQDEHYHLELTTEDHQFFLSASSEHGTTPAGYTRTQGAGRVCLLTPGHFAAILREPQCQKLLANAIRWCAGEIS